jgi:guanine deaminase
MNHYDKQHDLTWIKATAFTSETTQTVKALHQALWGIDAQGMIARIVETTDQDYAALSSSLAASGQLMEYPEGYYLLPGFVDLHIHAPQWAQAGTALDLPLNDWLHTYTFPLESRFSDLAFAETVYTALVDHLIANGTTTGLYFATVHAESSLRLAEICAAKGQRALVGKVVMDDTTQNPHYYCDASTDQALADTESFIHAVKALGQTVPQGVYPVVTPRFIPSCTDQALHGLGALAQRYDVHVQSHCSESDWEHAFVAARCGQTDAHALHHFGLLGDKSVMAHAGFLSDEDMALFGRTGTAVAHCPISNVYFGNAVTPVAKLMRQYDVDVGLGSDISGGFSPSLFDNVRQAVMASRQLEEGVDAKLDAVRRGVSGSKITLNEAFYLATMGGGRALSLPIGRLAVGYAFDVQVIDIKQADAVLPVFDAAEDLMMIFQKIMYLSKPANIREVWVQGRSIHQKA